MNQIQQYASAYTRPMTLLEVRKHIVATRKRLGYTQEAVAEDAGIGQSTVSRLENYETDMSEIEFETVRKIVEGGLGLQMGAFFAEIDKQGRGPRTATFASPDEQDKIVRDQQKLKADYADLGTRLAGLAQRVDRISPTNKTKASAGKKTGSG